MGAQCPHLTGCKPSRRGARLVLHGTGHRPAVRRALLVQLGLLAAAVSLVSCSSGGHPAALQFDTTPTTTTSSTIADPFLFATDDSIPAPPLETTAPSSDLPTTPSPAPSLRATVAGTGSPRTTGRPLARGHDEATNHRATDGRGRLRAASRTYDRCRRCVEQCNRDHSPADHHRGSCSYNHDDDNHDVHDLEADDHDLEADDHPADDHPADDHDHPADDHDHPADDHHDAADNDDPADNDDRCRHHHDDVQGPEMQMSKWRWSPVAGRRLHCSRRRLEQP